MGLSDLMLRCPVCGEPLQQHHGRCAAGHSFQRRNGVLRLVTPAFAAQVADLEAGLARFRAGNPDRIEDPDVFNGLPFNRARESREWALRAADVGHVIAAAPTGRALTVLDLGAWNGWLSHQLARLGHRVVAADYFVGEYDGLAAQRFYSSKFEVIQVDLGDLSVFDDQFDLVVVNHGLAFFTEPRRHLQAALGKVRAGGVLMVLGLQFFRDATGRRQRVADMEHDYQQRVGSPLFFRPTRGYLDWGDKQSLAQWGLQLSGYQHLWRQNLAARLRPGRPYYCYGRVVRAHH